MRGHDAACQKGKSTPHREECTVSRMVTKKNKKRGLHVYILVGAASSRTPPELLFFFYIYFFKSFRDASTTQVGDTAMKIAFFIRCYQHCYSKNEVCSSNRYYVKSHGRHLSLPKSCTAFRFLLMRIWCSNRQPSAKTADIDF